MILVIASSDAKKGGSILRIFRMSILRWYKHGFAFMFTKAADEFLFLERNTFMFPKYLTRLKKGAEKQILFIDGFLPCPSTDAGGYAAVSEIKIFQSLGYAVSFLAQNVCGDQNKRKKALINLGVEILVAPSLADQKFLLYKNASRFKLIYITRYNLTEAFVDTLRLATPESKIILNLADLHFLREMRLARIDPLKIAEAEAVKKRELRQIDKADLTLSYSSFELELLQKSGIEAEKLGLCPWVIDFPDLDFPGYDQREGIAFLGGFRHAPNVEAVEWFVANVWPRLHSRFPECEFYIFGSYAKEMLCHLDGVEGVVVKGWVENVAEVYNSCRVFIAPLQSGAGVKGKVVSALAYGVPCVLSPIAAEGIPVTPGKEVLLAESPAEWVEKISIEYYHVQRWVELAHNAHDFAVNHYTFERGRKLLKQNLDKILTFSH